MRRASSCSRRARNRQCGRRTSSLRSRWLALSRLSYARLSDFSPRSFASGGHRVDRQGPHSGRTTLRLSRLGRSLRLRRGRPVRSELPVQLEDELIVGGHRSAAGAPLPYRRGATHPPTPPRGPGAPPHPPPPPLWPPPPPPVRGTQH